MLVAVLLTIVALSAVGSLQLKAVARPLSAALHATTTPTPSPTPSPVAMPSARPTAVPQQLPWLPPLHALIMPGVLVTTGTPMSAGQARHIVQLAHANASLAVAVGQVRLGRGRTRALAADPVKIRVWSAPITGRATGVWQRAVIGEAVVAHAVAKANAVPLGGSASVARAASSLRLRIGALATTDLPGVGLVVNVHVGQQLGLVPGTGLLLAVPETDPAVTAAMLSNELGKAATVETVLTRMPVTAGWVPPAIGPITSPFGMRINPFTHQPQFHEGIDIGAPLAAPVYAMSAGEVLYAGAASGYGTEVVLAHPGGVTTVYGHVSQIFVTAGRVTAGQVIALVGSEGESTGPHLHAEVRVQDQPVDPVAWLTAHGVRSQR